MQELSAPLMQGESAQIVLDVPQSVQAPVYPGMHVGTAHLVIGGKEYAEAEVVASARVDRKGFSLDVRRVIERWTLSRKKS